MAHANDLKRVKHIILSVIWALAGLYLVLIVLTHIPPVQRFLGLEVSGVIGRKIGARIEIGRVDFGFLNRLIIDDVLIYDQSGKPMLRATRLSAKFDIVPLMQKKVHLSSMQLFGLDANLYRMTAGSKPNYQFLLDSLASKDTTSTTPLDLAINSLVIRNGKIRYNQLDVADNPDVFSPQHVNLQNISGHIILNALTDDSLNLNVYRFSFKEAKGLDVRSLHFKVIANKTHAELTESGLSLPNSRLITRRLTANYSIKDGLLQKPSLTYHVAIDDCFITPSDLSCFDKTLNKFTKPVKLTADLSGTSTSLRVKRLDIDSRGEGVSLHADGSIADWDYTPKWNAAIDRLTVDDEFIAKLFSGFGRRLSLPNEISRLGSISFKGETGGSGTNFSTKGLLSTNVGKASIAFGRYDKEFNGQIETNGFDIGHVLNNKDLGNLATNLNVEGVTKNGKIASLKAKGKVDKIDYKGYSYNNLDIDGQLSNGIIGGSFAMNDPNGKVNISGTYDTNATSRSADITAQVSGLTPSALGFTDIGGDGTYDFNVKADIKGTSLNDLTGTVDVSNFSMKSAKSEYHMASMSLSAHSFGSERVIMMKSDFGNAEIKGRFDYASLPSSFANLVGSRLNTLPGLPRNMARTSNNFTVNAVINSSDWLEKMFEIRLHLDNPLSVRGYINDPKEEVDMTLSMPDFSYGGSRYKDGAAFIVTEGDSLKAMIGLRQMADNGSSTDWKVNARAANNRLYTLLSFSNNGKMSFSGTVDTQTQFYKNRQDESTAHVSILPSNVNVGDSTWTILPSEIIYSKNRAAINNLAIEHNDQHIIVNGLATNSVADTVSVDLRDVDVAYVLNLVNFHSVDFGGKASGYAYLSNVFNAPRANANLVVRDFTFESGRLGVLSAEVNYDNRDGQVNLDATAYDEDNARTSIRGYVSTKQNYMDIGIYAENTRCEFLEGFCGSFMRDVNVRADGECHVVGDLRKVNLIGTLVANGSVGISTLNTTYSLRNDTLRMIPNEIQFPRDSVWDRNGNVGIISGALHHKSLTKLTYDLDITTDNLLAYDTHDFGDDTFYGTIYATGTCNIKGRKGTLDFDINATPNKGSFIVYNAASPSTPDDQSFIRWIDRDDTIRAEKSHMQVGLQTGNGKFDIPTDIHLNILANANPGFNLRVLMDKSSGDMVSLYGDGVIRASYYNKGSFDMFGTYNILHGSYDLTIQNIIRRNFEFQEGSNIVFGGDAGNAALNLNAQYVLNGVSLSDLNIGRSFSNNNTRVNCLMNISGTPNAPKIDFGLDLPTVNTEVKQMVTNLINSEEEMNQQVLYLLAVGRFYPQGSNNAVADGSSTQQNQTSLAMQSILSGQLSQQLNNILKNVTNNSNWNFGANISTGTEGFNDAEYEGLLSGRLLNNRLLFNGQFGYRDNPNATTSFIGDFDLRYLIYPNGNLAIRVYNQTNDRYFTRNSLNTQGLGFILKKDFNGWRDFWGLPRKDKAKAKKKSKKNK